MKFALLSEHKVFYRDNGFIVFENLIEALPPEGYNLWRSDSNALSQSRKLARIMVQLSGEKIIQLAFDWSTNGKALLDRESLNAGFCFQRLVGGLLLCSDGSGIYFHSKVPFVDLNLDPELLYFLIGYGGVGTRYVLNERDPHAHQLKDDGYGSGDCLNAEVHPILARL